MILNRVIIKNYIKPFLFSVFSFSFLIQMGHLFDRLEVFNKSGVAWKIVVLYLFSMIPLWLVQVLPICSLIAGVIVIGNMSISGELFCLRSSGVKANIVLRPLFVLALFLTGMTYTLGDWVVPRTTSYARFLYRTYVDREGIQKPLWKDILVLASHHRRINAKLLDLNRRHMENVTIEEFGDQLNLRQTLTAKLADWNPSNGWTFYDGIVRLFNLHGDEIVEEEEFSQAQINLSEKPSDFVPLEILPEELSIRQLKEYIRKMEQLGISPLKEMVQLQMKLAYPFTHLLVLAIGLPISFKATPAGGGRGRKSFGRMKTLSLALLVTLSYYMIMTIGQALSETRKISPFAGIWSANFIFLVIGLYLLSRVE